MLTVGIVVGVLLIVLFGIPVAASWAEKSSGTGSSGGGAFGVMQEIFHPAAHNANIVLTQQKERTDPAPIPGDDENKEPEPDQTQSP